MWTNELAPLLIERYPGSPGSYAARLVRTRLPAASAPRAGTDAQFRELVGQQKNTQGPCREAPGEPSPCGADSLGLGGRTTTETRQVFLDPDTPFQHGRLSPSPQRDTSSQAFLPTGCGPPWKEVSGRGPGSSLLGSASRLKQTRPALPTFDMQNPQHCPRWWTCPPVTATAWPPCTLCSGSLLRGTFLS